MTELRTTLISLSQNDKLEQYIELANAIEQANMPQQHDIFFSFFKLGNDFASLLNHDQQWALFLSQFELVLRSILNNSLPSSWRRSCYEALNNPLLSLQRIAKDNDRKRQLTSCYIKFNKEVSTVFKLHPF